MFVWVEWTCTRCNEKHTARFDVVVQHGKYGLPPNIKSENYYSDESIKIDDVAYNREKRPRKTTRGGGSKVFVPYDTRVQRILEVVRQYMTKFYSMKPDTYLAEVCSA